MCVCLHFFVICKTMSVTFLRWCFYFYFWFPRRFFLLCSVIRELRTSTLVLFVLLPFHLVKRDVQYWLKTIRGRHFCHRFTPLYSIHLKVQIYLHRVAIRNQFLHLFLFHSSEMSPAVALFNASVKCSFSCLLFPAVYSCLKTLEGPPRKPFSL